MSRAGWIVLAVASILSGLALGTVGLLAGWGWYISQGMPHGGPKGVSIWAALLIFGPVISGIVAVGWGIWRLATLQRPKPLVR